MIVSGGGDAMSLDLSSQICHIIVSRRFCRFIMPRFLDLLLEVFDDEFSFGDFGRHGCAVPFGNFAQQRCSGS